MAKATIACVASQIRLIRRWPAFVLSWCSLMGVVGMLLFKSMHLLLHSFTPNVQRIPPSGTSPCGFDPVKLI